MHCDKDSDLREPPIKSEPDALAFEVDLRPGSVVSALRPMGWMQRNDLVWGVLVGFVSPLFGSLLSIIVWVPFVWNLISTAIGRYPIRLSQVAALVSAVAAAYGAVKLGFTIAHSGLLSWRDWPGFFIFFSPVFYFLRLRLSNGNMLLDAVILGAGFSMLAAFPAAAYEAFWIGRRVELFCGNANVFAMMSALFGSLGALNVFAKTNTRRWLGVLAFLAMIFCVLVSGRRSMWAALPLLTLVIAWAAARSVPRRIFWRGLFATLAVALVGIVLASGTLRARLAVIGDDIARIEQSGDYNSSTGLRILMWKGGWTAFRQAPLAGYGYRGRMEAVRQALPEEDRRLIGFTHPHNAFLAALLDAGVLGLVVLLALLTAPIWVSALAPADSVWRLRLTAGMILTLCYTIGGATGIMFEHDLMNAAFVVMLIVLADSAIYSGKLAENDLSGQASA